MRQHRPLATCTQQIEDPVDHLTQIHFRRSAGSGIGRDPIMDKVPLRIGQVGGIGPTPLLFSHRVTCRPVL